MDDCFYTSKHISLFTHHIHHINHIHHFIDNHIYFIDSYISYIQSYIHSVTYFDSVGYSTGNSIESLISQSNFLSNRSSSYKEEQSSCLNHLYKGIHNIYFNLQHLLKDQLQFNLCLEQHYQNLQLKTPCFLTLVNFTKLGLKNFFSKLLSLLKNILTKLINILSYINHSLDSYTNFSHFYTESKQFAHNIHSYTTKQFAISTDFLSHFCDNSTSDSYLYSTYSHLLDNIHSTLHFLHLDIDT